MAAPVHPAPPLLSGELISLSELCGKDRFEEAADDGGYEAASRSMYMKFRPFLTRRQKLLKEHFRCEWCGVTSTPEMRPGPGGKKNALCNRYATTARCGRGRSADSAAGAV